MKWYWGLLTFDRGSDKYDLVPDACEGLSGYGAWIVYDSEHPEEIIRECLSSSGFENIEVEEVQVFTSAVDVRNKSECLYENIKSMSDDARYTLGDMHSF